MSDAAGGNDDDDGGEVPGSAEMLDWKSQQILTGIADAGGTADVGELRVLLGEENGSPVNYRINDKLRPEGLVSVARPGTEDGKPQAKVISLTGLGEEVVEEIRGGDDGDGTGTLTVDERLDRLEAGLDSKYGLWSLDRKRQFELTAELSRVMRNFIGKKYPDEFQEYADAHFDPDSVGEDNES